MSAKKSAGHEQLEQKRGMGEHQIKEMGLAINSILESLSDGQWRQYSELKQKTHLSGATLSKHLKTLKPIVEKHVDLESGKYPYPVKYRVPEPYGLVLRQVKLFHVLSEKMKQILQETKNPIHVLEYLNTTLSIMMMSLVKMIKDVEEETGQPVKEELVDIVYELRIVPFMQFYWTFLTTAKGIWNSADLVQTMQEQMIKMQQIRKQAEKKD